MKRFLQSFRYGEKGFTLIELLIVVAILGTLAVIVIPNASRFFGKGTLEGANTEAATVRTAVAAWVAEGGDYAMASPGTIGPGHKDSGFTGNDMGYTPINYFEGSIQATYTVDPDNEACMMITGTVPTGWGTGISWNATACQWQEV